MTGHRDVAELKRPDHKVLSWDKTHRNWFFSRESAMGLGQCHRYLEKLQKVQLRGLDDEPNILISYPRALLVIGRSQDWEEEQRRALDGLNARLHGIRVVTYDHLLAQARRFRELLRGSDPEPVSVSQNERVRLGLVHQIGYRRRLSPRRGSTTCRSSAGTGRTECKGVRRWWRSGIPGSKNLQQTSESPGYAGDPLARGLTPCGKGRLTESRGRTLGSVVSASSLTRSDVGRPGQRRPCVASRGALGRPVPVAGLRVAQW